MKRLIFIILLFSFLGKMLLGQQPGYDEIKRLIANTKDNADSIYFLNKQLLSEILKLNKEKEELVSTYISLSEYAMRTGNLPEAESYASEAALVCEKYKIEKKLARSYYQKARVFNQQSRSEEALMYLRKGKAVAERRNNMKELSIFLSQLGFAFANQKNLDSALHYQDRSLALSLETKDSISIAVAYSNIGYVYSLSNELATAKKYFYKSYAYRKTNKDAFVKLAALLDCAEIEQKTKNPTATIRLVNEALLTIKEKKMHALETSCYKHITLAYADLKRWDSACKYQRLYKAASDSLCNEQTLKASARVEARYQLNSKQNEIALLSEKDKNNELQVIREKTTKWVFVGGLILLIIILFMVFRQLKIKKMAFDKINEQKIIIEEKNKEITDSIRYAKRIQTALMSSEKKVESDLNKLKVKLK